MSGHGPCQRAAVGHLPVLRGLRGAHDRRRRRASPETKGVPIEEVDALWGRRWAWQRVVE